MAFHRKGKISFIKTEFLIIRVEMTDYRIVSGRGCPGGFDM